MNDKSGIDRVTAAFYDAFTNRDGVAPNVDSLYDLFLPQAIVTKNTGTIPEVYDPAGFVEPRRALLTSGELLEFCEEEVFERTEILGNVAQRFSLYVKSWRAQDRTHEGRGVKTLQFVRTPEGWKIASLAWDDERDGLAIPTRLNADVPIVETERLRLRGHRAGDIADCFAMWSDPPITRYIGGKPSSEQQAWARMLTFAGHWSLVGFGYWAIEERATGRYVGDLGFADFHRSVVTSMKNVPELGWALAGAFHGQGYATEAARAALAWADARFAWPRTVCMIDTGNAASIRVAEKCGYREFERTVFNDAPTIFFERFGPQQSG